MPYLETARVLRHDCVGPNLYELECLAPRIAAASAPGQFAHVDVLPVHSTCQGESAPGQGASWERTPAQACAKPLLRRPLSIYDVAGPACSGSGCNSDGHVSNANNTGDRSRATFLYKVRGAGTALLADVRPGDYLDILGPLGRGFSLPTPAQSRGARHQHATHALLIAGGVGIAPLVYLARALTGAGCSVRVFYGANTASETQAARNRLAAMNESARAGKRIELFTTTLDGSSGLAGIVTDLLTAQPSAEAIREIDFIYTCGPEPMMAAVEQFATARGIPGEISIETAMACGVGACLGCARRLKTPPRAGLGAEANPVYARVCKDGPVFPIGQVELCKALDDDVDSEEESECV